MVQCPVHDNEHNNINFGSVNDVSSSIFLALFCTSMLALVERSSPSIQYCNRFFTTSELRIILDIQINPVCSAVPMSTKWRNLHACWIKVSWYLEKRYRVFKESFHAGRDHMFCITHFDAFYFRHTQLPEQKSISSLRECNMKGMYSTREAGKYHTIHYFRSYRDLFSISLR